MEDIMKKGSESLEGKDVKLLTKVELELMTILWRIGEGSVAKVIAELPEERDLAYTSVSTILRILEQKKVLKTRKEGRSHIYIPLLSKIDYEAKTVRHVIDRVFEGAPLTLIKTLLDTVNLNDEELEEINKIIEKKGRDK
jgi:predicted transcriptional regulator